MSKPSPADQKSSPAQRDALIRLLRDDDPFTVSLVKRQLAERGAGGIPELADLLQVDDERVAGHVREVLGQIDAREGAREFSALCETFPENGDIEPATWLLSRALMPGADAAAARRQVDHWGERLAKILRGVSTAEKRVETIGDFLGSGLNFRGNQTDYYHVGNSLLPHVIETRLGIPISLTLLYMLVGRRAGLEIAGLNFPGHFLARHDHVIFDPFERGRILKRSDCQAILEKQDLVSKPEYFRAATPIAMLARLLGNLLFVYQSHGEQVEAAQVSGWIRALSER